ncbi:hypothetical protein BGZ70_002987 [Mortierella alpina]|uniref:Creatinase/aminopeptidase n=1 Tax=Mortierella alpina TaxID=64518 RepID=A0A9P6JB19_MORAP|nr:hypothetical protein BGZ70_002987 [Mortierella alpina]
MSLRQGVIRLLRIQDTLSLCRVFCRTAVAHSSPLRSPTWSSHPSALGLRMGSWANTPATFARPMSSATAASFNTTDRVQKLRSLMQDPAYNVTAFVIPSEDAHQSEYVADCDERRAFISGFSGSAGLAVVSLHTAALFTDGRYFLQASQQLDSNWTLMKSGLPDVPTWQEYLVKVLFETGGKHGQLYQHLGTCQLTRRGRIMTLIGIDPLVFTATDAKKLETELARVGSSLVPVPNLIDQIWDKRPPRPAHPLMTLSITTTGRSHTEKIKQLRRELEKRDVLGCVVSGLDEVAWLFNLRGSDVHCNPVFFAYAIVTRDKVLLYLQDKAVSDEVRQHLGHEIMIRPYDSVFEDLKAMSSMLTSRKQKMLLGTRSNLALAVAVGQENTIETRSPVTDAKAVKNEAELNGIRQCHLRDAAAVINYFAWLEDKLSKGAQVDEADGADQLQRFRAEQVGFFGPSFDTISSTGPNGAIIHYKPEKPTAARINPDQVYLCDSGGQYLDGTTDITRTLHFNTPKEHEKRCFTRVLQGHIAIDSSIFPEGTSGYILDAFSRRALWSDGLDFRHGTGHGVGAFLNVHEGPHGCGTRIGFNEVPLVPGMTLTNEPGYYEDGQFGIRIENVLLVRNVQTKHRFGGKAYYGFEHVTFVPIQTKMIERSLLSGQEAEWLNRYHEECLEKVTPFLKPGSPGHEWLKREAVSV